MENDFGEIAKKALAPDPAPDSLVARYGLATLKGLGQVPKGMLHAVQDDLAHPLHTVTMLGAAAALGAGVKAYLPNLGTGGKIAGVAIGAYLTYRAAEPIFDAYSIAHNATSMNDIDVAAKVIGDVGGAFAVNAALSGAAYKLGGMGAEKYLMKSPFPPGGVNGIAPRDVATPNTPGGPIQPRWQTVLATNMPGFLGISSASSTSMTFEQRLAGIQKFTPSERLAPDADFKGDTSGDTVLDVTVQLKSKATDAEMEKILNEVASGKRPALTDKEFEEKFGATQESLDQVKKFAAAYDLKVTHTDLRTGRVVLTGTVDNVEEAFKTKISDYAKDGSTFHDRAGALFVPKVVGKNIEGVFGIDQRPQAKPRVLENDPKAESNQGAADQVSFRPDQVADFYNFPKGTTGKGQGIAVIELGGGMVMENEQAYYKEMGLKMPDIKILELNGAKNKPGADQRADKEVSLDSQVIGAVAPDAKQLIIFAKNSEQGFIDAIGRGAFPLETETPNQAISISWGQPIEDWSAQGKRGMNLALKKAALKGVSVFAASGDDGAVDRPGKGEFTVDYPAADPYVTGTGGTRLVLKDGKLESEVVWNDRHGSTGGGISPDEVPEFQKNLKLPRATDAKEDKIGRGVPDVAGNASQSTGYKIRVRGNNEVVGGTSAVAPLYAALAVRINEGLGGGKTVGYMNPFLYEQGLSGKAQFFRDITTGHNNGYDASKGWDPVTGWGSLDGEKLLQAYKDKFKQS